MLPGRHKRTRTFMVAAFGLIAGLLGLLELLQWIEGRDTRRNIEEIQDNSLVSLRLVDRISADVARERTCSAATSSNRRRRT